jgi:sigma-B regulation protein RsbU (phosphoserine phosphatase)
MPPGWERQSGNPGDLAMASNSQTVNPQPARRQPFSTRASEFWQHVTDGLELNQLWNQFRTDARASYSLYSREIDSAPKEGVRRGRRWLEVAKQFFWAIMEKLSPARRVLLLLALLTIIFNPELSWTTKGGTHVIGFDLRLWGGLLMFVLLILEVADRVVMKRDLQIAREIQMWLLPANPPHVSGIDIAFATRPANTVAGDYYDVFARPAYASANQSYLVAVADVAGKSIPAALLMATFQASLKTLSATPSSLAQLVKGMNHYACSNSQGGLRFITAFLAEYEPATRTLTYINAGHNQPILRRDSGLIERLDAGGLPFGIKGDANYLTGTVALGAGDWLVVFTDGVVEAVNEPGTDYGEERLISILHAGTATSPVNMLSRIMTDLDFFVGNTPQQDDITCLLVKAV